MTHPMSASIAPAVKAVIAFAREIAAHEKAQIDRHFANIGLGCDCEDCTKRYKYPAEWYAIARKVLNNA